MLYIEFDDLYEHVWLITDTTLRAQDKFAWTTFQWCLSPANIAVFDCVLVWSNLSHFGAMSGTLHLKKKYL